MNYFLLAVFWVIIVLASLFFNVINVKKSILDNVEESSRSFFQEIQSIRYWNASHGGVYVPITDSVKPNPYLIDSLRDVVTTGGLRLTKVNPAFMTRQLSEISIRDSLITYHLTSLNPLRPDNRADAWETKALKSFRNGKKEAFELIETDSRSEFRYMAPLIVEESCLKCHAHQEYKLGDIRGGISIDIQAINYLSSAKSQISSLSIIHSAILLFGLLGIYFFSRFSMKQFSIIDEKNAELEVKIIEKEESEEAINNYAQEILLSSKMLEDRAGELNITNAKLIESEKELLELNSMKDKFFSIIAHDLKNPLASFKDITCLMAENYNEFSETERLEFIELMKDSSKQIYSLLENLLQWSRSQTGKIIFDPDQIDIKMIADSTLSLLKIHSDNKKIRLINNIEKSLYAFGVANMISTVIRNLVSNAIKFTDENGEIRLKAKPEGDFVRVSIIDDGVGMKAGDMDKLFRIDVNHSTIGTGDEKGTGLGLILCKEFVEKNGGKIWVESKRGVGSTFSFTVPLKGGEEEA